jgi:hypothetical protein
MTRRRLLHGAIALVLAGTLGVTSATWLNHDVALSLTAATLVVDGVKLYEDLLELNPPLFIVYALPAAWLAAQTGLPGPLLLLLFVHGIALVSLALAGWSLQRLPLPMGPLSGELLLAVLAFLMAPFAVPLFGQREHLFLLFWIPYPLLFVARASGTTVRTGHALAVGAWAGLGIALKPFFVLPWLGVEAYALWRRRRFELRPETLAAAGVVALYVVAVFVVWPGFFGTIVPLIGATFWAYNNPLTDVLTRIPALLTLSALAAAAVVSVRDQALRDLRGVLWGSAAGSLLQAVVQTKGWNYHFYPAIVASGLLLLVCGIGLWTQRRGERAFPAWPAAALPAALIAAAAVAWMVGLRRLTHMHGPARSLAAAFEECRPGGLVAFLTTDVDPTFPAMTYSHLRWRSRFIAVWPLPAVVKAEHAPARYGPPTPELRQAERFTIDTVVADLEGTRPDLLVVDRRKNKQAMEGIAFDFVEYFSRDERFRRFFADYRLARQVGPQAIYVRAGSQACEAMAARVR